MIYPIFLEGTKVKMLLRDGKPAGFHTARDAEKACMIRGVNTRKVRLCTLEELVQYIEKNGTEQAKELVRAMEDQPNERN